MRKMKLHLGMKDRVRVTSDCTGENFIDVSYIDYHGIFIQLYPFMDIELRKKDNQIGLLVFPKDVPAPHRDLGPWKDAEILYSSKYISNVHDVDEFYNEPD